MAIDAITHRRGRLGVAHGTHPRENGEKQSRPGPQRRELYPIREWLDYRLLLIASLLPDIIDKPLGMLALKDTISYGHIYAHTFLFLLVTGMLGAWLFRKHGKGWLLIMAFGSLMHDLEDQMWRWPDVLWWPLKGWSFPREDTSAWFSDMWRALATEPDVFIPELVGIGLLIFAAVKVFRSRRFLYALKTGHIDRLS